AVLTRWPAARNMPASTAVPLTLLPSGARDRPYTFSMRDLLQPARRRASRMAVIAQRGFRSVIAARAPRRGGRHPAAARPRRAVRGPACVVRNKHPRRRSLLFRITAGCRGGGAVHTGTAGSSCLWRAEPAAFGPIPEAGN